MFTQNTDSTATSATERLVLAARPFFTAAPMDALSPRPKRLPTTGVRLYEKPVANSTTSMNMVLTKLAAARLTHGVVAHHERVGETEHDVAYLPHHNGHSEAHQRAVSFSQFCRVKSHNGRKDNKKSEKVRG